MSTEPEDAISLGFNPRRLDRLYRVIDEQIAQGLYPGAQIAFARDGKLAIKRTFGLARVSGAARPARGDTLWLLYSSTKPLVAAGIWWLADQGWITFHDRVADHIPGFERHGKENVTIYDVLTHQSGFPHATVPPEAFTDHERLREAVCDFRLEFAPGERVYYHGSSGWWVLAVLIEAVSGQDFREFLRHRILERLGLERDVFVGVPPSEFDRIAEMVDEGPHLRSLIGSANTPAFWQAGVPGGGGYATADGLALFYQAILADLRTGAGQAGEAPGLWSRRLLEYVTRNHTGERIDEALNRPMRRGLGVHVRGDGPSARGLGTIASPATFGHGGAGSSYSWADPQSGVSFTFLSNRRLDEPTHSRRIDLISNLAHACIQV